VYVWVKPRPYTHKMWTEVSSSVPRFVQLRLLLSPIIYKCLLKMLFPVSRSITTLDCVLLKDNNRVLVARTGPEIKFRACLCVQQQPRRNTRYWFSIQRFIFLRTFCLQTYMKDSSPINRWTQTSLASLSAITFPRTLPCPGTQYSLTVCRVEISSTSFWHCCTREDIVLAAWSNFRAAWLPDQKLA
jgi:hypothetical protein